jgi:hypothetical protein
MVTKEGFEGEMETMDKNLRELVKKTEKSLEDDIFESKNICKDFTMDKIAVPGLCGKKSDKFDSLGEFLDELYSTNMSQGKDLR